MLKKKLETWMAIRGCSRQQLAEMLNVSRRTVDGWLATKSRPIPEKMRKPIEDLIEPKLPGKELSEAEKEFHALPDIPSRELWIQHQLEQILILSHRARAYWDTHHPDCPGDYDFMEEITDITLAIQEISTNVTSLGAYHADCLIFEEYDDEGNFISKP